MIVELAAQHQIDQFWPVAKGYLEQGIEAAPNDLTLGGLYTGCRTGHHFLIIGYDDDGLKMASVWQFETWRHGPVFRCLVLGGQNMDQWIDAAFEKAKAIALLGGATRLVATGRPGWAKVIKGARAVYTAFELEM